MIKAVVLVIAKVWDTTYVIDASIANLKKIEFMENNINEQIDMWREAMHRYEEEKADLQKQIGDTEALRKEIDELPVGHPTIVRYYTKLASLHARYTTLPAKIGYCKDNIETLKREIEWS